MVYVGDNRTVKADIPLRDGADINGAWVCRLKILIILISCLGTSAVNSLFYSVCLPTSLYC